MITLTRAQNRALVWLSICHPNARSLSEGTCSPREPTMDALVRLGLVTREGRLKRFTLTEAGRAALTKSDEVSS